MNDEPVIRGPLPADVPYIMDTWLRVARTAYKELPDDIFFPAYRELIKRILQSSDVMVLATESKIYGYSVFWGKDEALHWLHLRTPNQEQAKLLLSRLPAHPFYTMRCKMHPELLGRRQEILLRRLRK